MRSPFSANASPMRSTLALTLAITLVLPALEILAATASGDPDLKIRAGLELWIDAANLNAQRGNLGLPPLGSGNAVDRILDASSHARHFAQHERSFRPTFRQELGLSFLFFDGKDDALSASGWGLKLDAATLFVVASTHSNAGGFRALLSCNRKGFNDYTTGLNFDLGPAASSQVSMLSLEGAGCPGAAQLLTSSPLPFGGWHFLNLETRVGARSVRLSVDGKEQGSRDRAASLIAMDDVVLGGRLYSNVGEPPYIQGQFHGAIAEVLVFGRILAPEERASVEQYLRTKYGPLLARPPALEGNTKPLVLATNPPPVQFLVPGFQVRALPVSLKNVNCVRYRPDGKLVALKYDGSIDLLEDTNGDGLEDRVIPFWTSNTLRAPIGMALTPPGFSRGQGVFVAAKGKVSLLLDTQGDERADQEIIVAEGWKEISHGVDALGVAVDQDGNVYFGLGTANFTDAYLIDGATGKAQFDLKSERGTILKISPDFKTREIVCTGIRFPVALAFNQHGDLFCTDQEGATWLPNGNPLDELLYIQPGRHYGFPPRHPKYLPSVIDEPSVFDYAPQHQSTCGLFFNDPISAGRTFGPAWWRGDALVCGYSRGKVWRTKLVRTAAGYVAQNQLIACMPSLTVDACVSPAGDLVIAAHTGEPDWGSGPNGNGLLYKVSYADTNVPQPVLAWPASPSEIRIGFDRPLDPGSLKDLAERIDVTQGAYASAGDRFESKHPGYAVVYSQLSASRQDVPVQTVSYTPDRRTLILHTKALRSADNYAITLKRFAPSSSVVVHPFQGLGDVDLLVNLNGLRAEWQPESSTRNATPALSGWEGWLPHLDLDVSRSLTTALAEQEALWSRLSSSGTLKLQGQLDLWQMLQPAYQPGTKPDHERPREQIRVVFQSSAEFSVTLGGRQLKSHDNASGGQEVVFELEGREAWMPFEAAINTGRRDLGFTATWSTSLDSRARALSMARFVLPWAKARDLPDAPSRTQVPPELAGGNWLRGKELFFGDAAKCSTCHMVRGEGNPVGPDLSNLVERDYASVLKDIRYPNAALNPDHLSYAIQLADGEELNAVLRSERPEGVLIADAGGQRLLPRSQVKSLRPTSTSLMPEGLDQVLGQARLKDLLTFLITVPLEPSPIIIPGLPAPRSVDELRKVLGTASPGPAGVDLRPLRILLCSGPKDHGENEHDYPLWQQRWSKLLALSEGVTVTMAKGFPPAEQMKQADVLVFYSNNPGWSASAARDLKEFQERGGGLVYIHFAVDGHAEPGPLAERIGLAWRSGKAKFRHGPLSLTLDSAHPIARGLPKLDLIDESYWDLEGDESRIHLIAQGVEEGRNRPLMWTLENGPGRVFVSIPGHYTWTFDDPLFRLLLLRGICWTAHQPEDRLSLLATLGTREQRATGSPKETGLRVAQ